MFNKRNRKNTLNLYEEDTMNISDKEEEIIDSYEEDVEEEIVEKKKPINFKTIINVFFAILIAIMLVVSFDIVCIAKYEKGPYFAIPTKDYKDGGSKAYYGLGYKVIKYHQIQGRRDMELGTWKLKYNTNPITLKDIDLAIELYGNETTTYKKYYKKFVRVVSAVESIDKKNNTITLSYNDEGKKYSLDIKCSMASDKKLDKIKENKEITVIGTVKDFDYKTTKKVNTIYLENCFAEQ